jgi:cyclic-di-GMP phosphodiesterase TipF (flagellum assembly factor)
LRPEGASATGGAPASKAPESGVSNGSSNIASAASPATEPPLRATGNAALARRAAGPG